jgi:catechol 2,3-dioxygenase-like lactoylglutathione lyase family enzyme
LISGLDHLALIVRDLDAAVARYTALLGCAPNWRGADGGAGNVWFQLDNMALDIISPIGAGATGDQVRANLDKHGEGLWAIAYATPDIEEAQSLLERRGAAPTKVFPFKVTTVGSDETRRWTMAAATLAGVTTFLVEQKPEAAPWPRCEKQTPSAVTGLDHVVVRTPAPDRAQALYGAKLGLDMRLDRTAPEWGTRLMFFRCGDLIVEVAHDLKAGVSDGDDEAWGVTWRVDDIDGAHARCAGAGFNISEVRTGRRPGTRVFTVRDGTFGVPTLFIGS